MIPEVRADIIAEARTWIGTPYVHQGRFRGLAVDCIGVPICVIRALGLVAPDFDVNGYSPTPDGTSLIGAADKHATRISFPEMTFGDLIVIRWARQPQHFGIIADYLHGGFSMIHAYGFAGQGEVIEQRLDESMLKRFVAAYRLPGVTA